MLEIITVFSARLLESLTPDQITELVDRDMDAMEQAAQRLLRLVGGRLMATPGADDCTNFVSQALYWGYLPEVGGSSQTDLNQWWYNLNNQTWSNTWTVAPDLRTFLLNRYANDIFTVYGTSLSPTIGVYPPNPTVNVGDPLFYDWDYTSAPNQFTHATIIVAYGTDPTSGWVGALVDSHSTNRYHAIWTLAPYNSQYLTTEIDGVHITY